MCTAETTVEINVIIDEIIMKRNTEMGMWLKQIYRKYFAGKQPGRNGAVYFPIE